MADPSSPALSGDVEWLPRPGGSRVLRLHPPTPDPPALILSEAGGGERRIEAAAGPSTDYEVPGTLDWTAAWLQWPDGTRARVRPPHGSDADVIELRPRRQPGDDSLRGSAGAATAVWARGASRAGDVSAASDGGRVDAVP